MTTQDVLAVRSRRASWKVAALVGVVLVGLVAVYATPLARWLRPEGVVRLRDEVLAVGGWAPLGFLVATALAVTLGVPRLLCAAVGGSAFGWIEGTALALAGTLLGCLSTFGYVRAIGGAWVDEHVQASAGGVLARLAPLHDAFARHGVVMSLVLRTAPVGNCHLNNVVMALTPMSWSSYALGTAIGVLPDTAVYALLGSAALGAAAARLTAAGMLLVALGGLHYVLSRRLPRVREVARALSDQGI